MTALTPDVGTSAAARINPVAKLAAVAVLSVVLVLSIDVVSASVALACELVLLPFAGVGARRMLLRTGPVLVAAPLSALTIALYGRPSGDEHFAFGLIRITDGSLELALATALRVLAIGLPSVVLFLTVDPTDFADGLAQLLRLPARFVVGALGGMRLIELFADDWRSLELARRARGLGDRGRLRRFAGLAFALLVLSLRRGSKLATAMEARGFGAPGPRTWARRSRLHARDAVLIGIAVVIATLALTIAVTTGFWNPTLAGFADG